MTEYPTEEEIHAIHEEIVEGDEGTEAGIRKPGDAAFAVNHIKRQYAGENLHEEAAHLLRLIAVNHPYVDGNKRTALTAAARLYDLNGYSLEPDDEVRTILKRLATDERQVAVSGIAEYLKERAEKKD